MNMLILFNSLLGVISRYLKLALAGALLFVPEEHALIGLVFGFLGGFLYFDVGFALSDFS